MDLNDRLNVLESQPSFEGLYTQICLCYSVPDNFSYSEIVKRLTTGLERLSESFPWVAGQVVQEKMNGNTGVFKITPLEEIPRLVVKDLRNDPSMPTMNILKRSRFASSMLDENIIAPRNTLPGTSAKSSLDFPVFSLQATFITGGLLLTFVSNHNSNDMVGQGLIMSLLSKACGNGKFTSEELSTGNLTRRNLIPTLNKSYLPGPELAYQLVKQPPSDIFSKDTSAEQSPAISPDPECTWAYFIFQHASLRAIKSLATENYALSSGFVSTDDSLTSFIYQSITRARLHRIDPTTKVTFTRAIDCRRYLDIPPTYLGLAQNLTYHTYTVGELAQAPLGSIASDLRKAVDPTTSTLRYDTCALATFLNNTPDKNVVNFTATLDLSKDIMLSSWAKVNCYDLDFNLGLGKAEAVRRPQICVPVESLVYFMPKALDGEIAVLLCLRNEDLERLRADKEFGMYAEYIG
jgi:hypothetical protein